MADKSDVGTSQLDSSKFKIYGMGHVAEDIKENSFEVKVFPVEITTGNQGAMDAATSTSVNTETSGGEHRSTVLDKGKTITCKWIPIGATNRITPPNVCKGEMVLIWNYAGTDQYYWSTMDNEMDLRKNEKATWFFSNVKNIGKPDLKKAYHWTVDTINKFVRLFTANNDGEYTTYDFKIDTKNGIITIMDGKNNMIKLESQSDKLTITTNKNVEINTTDCTVNASSVANINATSGTVNIKGGTVNIN